MATAVPATATSQTQLRVYSAFPMNHQNDFTGLAIHIRHDLMNQCANDALLQTNIRAGRIPNTVQVRSQLQKFVAAWSYPAALALNVPIHTCFQFRDLLQSGIPASFQLLRHQTILRVGKIILLLSSLHAIARCLEVSL